MEQEKSNRMLCFDERASNSSSREDTMKSNTGRFITIVAICLGLMIPLSVTFAGIHLTRDIL